MKKYLLLLLLPILSYASIGKITVLKGDVKIQRASGTIVAKNGTTLEKNDFIKTDKNGKVQIVFSDKTIFTIGKNSTLDIADYLYDESQPSNNRAKFNVLKGAFSSITGRIGKLNKSKFKLKTRSASIGIRGTIVKANQDTVMCTQGAITVTTNSGISMDVEAGYKTNVSTGTPTKPETIENGEVDKLGVDIGNEQQDENGNNTLVDTADKIAVTGDVHKDTAVTTYTRDVKLSGRTIDTDGKQQYVNVEIENLDGDLKLDSATGMKMVDDQGNAIETSKDDTVVWGYWADNENKKWVAGQVTDTSVIDNLRNETKVTNATYTGQVMGNVNENDAIKMDSSNEVKVNFALGAGQNTADGTIKFDTKSGQSWNTSFTGTTSGSTFSSNSVSGTAGTSSVTKGSVDGQFYGDKAESVGGTFSATTGTDTANGVFKASK